MITEIPAFDALEGAQEPTDCFGGVLTGSAHESAMCHFAELCDEADNAVKDIFGRELLAEGRISELDDVINEMWENGWNPETGDLNLFVLHFGVLLTAAMLSVEQTTPVFRSESVLNHVSVWRLPSGTEYFPVHKVLKCLVNRRGESASQMYNDLARKAIG